MGRLISGRQGAGSGPIVAFDFDGTLSVRDSFIAYLAWRSGPAPYAANLARLAPDAVRYLFDRDRQRLKAAAVGVFLKGLTREALARSCEAFAASPR